jgi:hypothetical protein
MRTMPVRRRRWRRGITRIDSDDEMLWIMILAMLFCSKYLYLKLLIVKLFQAPENVCTAIQYIHIIQSPNR